MVQLMIQVLRRRRTRSISGTSSSREGSGDQQYGGRDPRVAGRAAPSAASSDPSRCEDCRVEEDCEIHKQVAIADVVQVVLDIFVDEKAADRR